MQCWQNFLDMLDGGNVDPPPPESRGVVDRIMLTEREAVMCSSLSQAVESGMQTPPHTMYLLSMGAPHYFTWASNILCLPVRFQQNGPLCYFEAAVTQQ